MPISSPVPGPLARLPLALVPTVPGLPLSALVLPSANKPFWLHQKVAQTLPADSQFPGYFRSGLSARNSPLDVFQILFGEEESRPRPHGSIRRSTSLWLAIPAMPHTSLYSPSSALTK